MVSAPGNRERKKREIRQRLLAAALDLFVTRGYAETSMDDIAARGDVSRATVFNYYARKEDFLVAWIETRRAAAREQIARDSDGPTGARLREALVAICKLHERDAASRALIRAWLQAGGPLLERASDTAAVLRDVLDAGQKRGEIRRDVDTNSAALALLDVYLGALYRWAAEPERKATSLTRDLVAALAPLLRGLEAAVSPIPRPGKDVT